MATSRKTIATYRGTGTQKTFAFNFDYLQKSFIKVSINGTVLTYGIDYTVTNRQVDLLVAPAVDVLVVVYRETSTGRLVSWEDASVLRAADMTLFEVQLLHIAEETQDKVQDSGMALDPEDNIWDARFHTIKNVNDPTKPEEVVTKRYFESVQAGYIQSLNALLTNTTTQATAATTKATEAAGSAAAAKTSEMNAKTSETNAASSQAAASGSASAAASSASAASGSAGTASAKATDASNSASAASMSATQAANSATAAAASAAQASNNAGYTKAQSDGLYMAKVPSIVDNVHKHLPSGGYITNAGGVDWYVMNLLNPSSSPTAPKFFQLTMDAKDKTFHVRIVNDISEVNSAWQSHVGVTHWENPDGTSWWRRYSDGFIEMGGIASKTSTALTIYYPLTVTKVLSALVTPVSPTAVTGPEVISAINMTNMVVRGNSYAASGYSILWELRGRWK